MSTTTAPAEIEIPREFLLILQTEAQLSIIDVAGEVSVLEGRKADAEIERLRVALASRDALLTSDAIAAGLLKPISDAAIRGLHYKIAEHDHENLEDLARLVDFTRRMTAWRDQHLAEAVAA